MCEDFIFSSGDSYFTMLRPEIELNECNFDKPNNCGLKGKFVTSNKVTKCGFQMYSETSPAPNFFND